MHRLIRTLLASLALGAAIPPAAGTDGFDRDVAPFIREHCIDCHGSGKPKGDLDLERFRNGDAAAAEPSVWQDVAEQVAAGEMPPRDKPQPAPEDRDRLLRWIDALLDRLAAGQAGDPGPVVLRRLSNAEYTYTIRDLTGLPGLDPAREFPVDGAAGEGFMNTGNALVMSPALLTKYLDAASEVATHLVLLPDGIGFTAPTSRRDRTELLLSRIRDFYRRYTDSGGGSTVNLQGIVFETNAGGRLPVERYLAALLASREGVAPETDGLSPRYLALLKSRLEGDSASPVLAPLRARWRTATSRDIPSIVAGITGWQKALWRFQSVGHIGKAGGPAAWQEPVTPLAPRREFRVPVPGTAPEGRITLHLAATDAGDGARGDVVRWENPRFTGGGRPDLPLRAVRSEVARRTARRERLLAAAGPALAAASELRANPDPGSAATGSLARRHGLDPGDLGRWLDVLGLGTPPQPAPLDGLFADRMEKLAGHGFINGWGRPETPSAIANASDREVRVPGRLPGRSLALHPSPTRSAVLAWRSPHSGPVRVSGLVRHAHPECGNGVTWTLELRQGTRIRRLATGTAQGDREFRAGPFEVPFLHAGDVVALVIGPRDGNHACDTTLVDLAVRAAGDGGPEWNAAAEISADILAGNPGKDSRGNPGVWNLLSEATDGNAGPAWSLPVGSLLEQWVAETDPEARNRIAARVTDLLTGSGVPSADPDRRLVALLTSLDGPLVGDDPVPAETGDPMTGPWGADPSLFGPTPGAPAAERDDLVMRGPGVVEFQIPLDLVAGRDFVVTGRLDDAADPEGSVQLRAGTGPAPDASALHPGNVGVGSAGARWTDGPGAPASSDPVIVADDSAAGRRFEAAFAEFRDVFPAALCYEKIVPVDEVVTLTLHYREDGHLQRLMLGDREAAELDRLWDELHYVSHDALALVDAFEQLWQFATQDADPSAFEPLREPIRRRAEAFRGRLVETEPAHVDGAIAFADRAWRRPLSDHEKELLRRFYAGLRTEGLPHEDAVRFLMVRILTAPAFLYHFEVPGPGPGSTPVSDWELASRLSYFLWSGPPDDRLREAASRGSLRDPAVLAAEARRMLQDPRVRRLATEFGCAWLHIHGFDTLDEKSERHFPTFAEVRPHLYEEAIRFIADLFQSDLPVLTLLDADHTFLNGALAAHYGVSGVTGPDWRRVEGVRARGRGGVLGLGAVLAKQAGASRTSPILRGNWLCEVVLGEKLPRPPAGVPVLPEDESATEGLTMRELVERHSRDPRCSGCHVRIDPYGFALEAFDAIGRLRERDLGDRPVMTRVRTLSGVEFEGLEGLRAHLLSERREDVARQFCRKLLGYALGRGIQLSDRPLLQSLRATALAGGGGVASVVEGIVLSRQFREIRGREAQAVRQP